MLVLQHPADHPCLFAPSAIYPRARLISDTLDSSSADACSSNEYLKNIRDTAYLSHVQDATRNLALLLGLALTLFTLLMAEGNLIRYMYRILFAIMALFICVVSLSKIYLILVFIKNADKTCDNKNFLGEGRSTYLTVLGIIAVFNVLLIVTIVGYSYLRFSDTRERLAPTLRKLIQKANRGD